MSIADCSPSIDKMYQGDVFTGIISHIIDHETFFVVKTESTVVLANLQLYMSKNEPLIMFWFPSINEMFLIYLDEYFRAKRVELNEPDTKNTEFMEIYLIDTGETLILPINGLNVMNYFFMIPEEFLNVPPLAVKCKWTDDENDKKNMLEFLKGNILRNILTFDVLRIREETTIVNIYHFEQDAITPNIENVDVTPMIEQQSNSIFTPEESKELYEEPLATSDALVAVHGYSTKEDKLCQFYDPKTGGCFKGAFCKLKHLPLSTDSYLCRDREEIFIEKKDYSLIIPQQYYDINITYIISVSKFIFRFIDPDYERKLGDILTKVNNFSNIQAYKKIAFIPEVSELVLFKDCGIFKRAKIIDNSDEFCVIWSLDEGIIKRVNNSTLYNWNLRINDPNFLTDEMEISNIIPIKNNELKGKSRLLEFQKKSLKALTVQTIPTLKCRLFDEYSNDIGEVLIKEGFAIENHFEIFTDFTSNEVLPI